MTDENYLQQALDILSGNSMMQAHKLHLEALSEHYETRLIKLCNMLEVAKREVLNG